MSGRPVPPVCVRHLVASLCGVCGIPSEADSPVPASRSGTTPSEPSTGIGDPAPPGTPPLCRRSGTGLLAPSLWAQRCPCRSRSGLPDPRGPQRPMRCGVRMDATCRKALRTPNLSGKCPWPPGTPLPTGRGRTHCQTASPGQGPLPARYTTDPGRQAASPERHVRARLPGVRARRLAGLRKGCTGCAPCRPEDVGSVRSDPTAGTQRGRTFIARGR